MPSQQVSRVEALATENAKLYDRIDAGLKLADAMDGAANLAGHRVREILKTWADKLREAMGDGSE